MRGLVRMTLSMIPFLISVSGIQADVVGLKDGTLVTGKIHSSQEGILVVETQGGRRSISIEKMASFVVEPGIMEGSQDFEPLMERIIQNLDRIASRMESISQRIETLEMQLLNVQTGQDVQTRHILERTREMNPAQRLVVRNENLVKAGGGYTVTGQVWNESGTPLSGIHVDVIVYGGSGRLAKEGGTKQTRAAVTPIVLEPGQVGTFSARFKGRFQIDRFDVIPQGARPARYHSDSTNKNAGRQYGRTTN